MMQPGLRPKETGRKFFAAQCRSDLLILSGAPQRIRTSNLLIRSLVYCVFAFVLSCLQM
jgi:hypothetical protein